MSILVSDMYTLGRKCIFCRRYGLYKLKNKQLKCRNCRKKYSLAKLKRDINVLYYFYLEVSAHKTSKELHLNYKSVINRFMFFRKMITYHLAKEFSKMYGELEMDEAY